MREFGFLCLGEELLDRLEAEEAAAAAAAASAPAESSAESATVPASREPRQRGSSPVAARSRRGPPPPGTEGVEMTEFKRTPDPEPESEAGVEGGSADSGHITFGDVGRQGGSAAGGCHPTYIRHQHAWD